MDAFVPFVMHPARQVAPPWLDWLAGVWRAAPDAVSAPPPDDDASLPALAAHGLLPLLYVRLRATAAWERLPARFSAALATAFQHNAARTFLLDQELARIDSALHPATPLGLLKGAALGRTVYGSPAERPVSDLDLLVAPRDIDRVAGTLGALGYAAHGLTARGRSGAWQRRYRAEMPFTSDLPGVGRLLVELHWSLVELPYYIARMAGETLWQDAAPAPHLHRIVIPDPVILLLHTCAHLGLHHSTDLRLIWLLDVHRLCQQGAVNWERFLGLVQAWRLGKPAYETLRAAHAWSGAAVPAAALAAAQRLSADPISARHWGLGDEQPGRAWRRAGVSLATLPWADKAAYAAWLGSRVLARPRERRSFVKATR